MLRTLLKRVEGNLITSYVGVNCLNPVYSQTVRWRRKPRWLPTARSKLFRIPTRTRLPREEAEELKRLHNIYKTEMKSIRKFFCEHKEGSLNTDTKIATPEDEEEEHKRCIELNNLWNMEVGKLREDTLAKEKEAELEIILQTLEETKKEMEERKVKIEEIVRLEKEKSKTYITADNIDEAIEHALENTVDFNFSIDLKGNFYHGKSAKPPKESSHRETEENIAATSA